MLNVRVNSFESDKTFHGKVRIFDCLLCLLSFRGDNERFLPVRKVSDHEEYASWPFVLVNFNRVTFLNRDNGNLYKLTPRKIEKLKKKFS